MGAGSRKKAPELGTNEQVFLVAHSDGRGRNVAQATVIAANRNGALERFRREFPERDVQTIGVKGVG